MLVFPTKKIQRFSKSEIENKLRFIHALFLEARVLLVPLGIDHNKNKSVFEKSFERLTAWPGILLPKIAVNPFNDLYEALLFLF